MTRPRPLRAALALAASVALGSCTGAVPPPGSDVSAFVDAFVASVNAADLDRFVSFFDEDATAFFPSAANAPRRSGRAAIRAAVALVFAAPETPLVPKDLVVTADGALVVASFDVGTGTLHSRRTLVLRRTPTGFRVVHLHASNVRAESP